jgi:serine/threonine protein kinase
MLSLEGKQLGNYDIIRRIRVGGMGAVYEGRQRTAFDRRVAIKVILGDYATDPDMRRRFAREAKTVARLHHPHILALIEFGDEQGILYLVMPFIDGGTLTSYLRHNLPSLGEVATIYEQVLDAVECAHDHGLIHRDIKSSNVLLELHRNTPPYAYLADFGLVRTVRQNTSSQVGKPIPLEQVPGTPHYMAPEQTLGIVTPLTDIYALGVLLFQMLTGNLPYNDADDVRVIQMHLQAPIPSPCEHDASIPEELGDVVKKAMAKRPENRFRTVAELRKAFFQALDGPLAALPMTENVTPTAKPTRPIEPEDVSQIIIEQVHEVAPRNKKTIALNGGRPLDPPKPIIMHQKPRGAEATPVAVHEKRERVEHLDRIKRPDTAEPFLAAESIHQRPHITEEPIISSSRKRKRLLFPLLAVIVPLILIILLVAPRIFDLNLIPFGISLPGSSSKATVRITPKSQKIHNSFILTASPKVTTTNLAVRTIPDRLITDDAQGSTTITTTGINETMGTQAQGIIQLINPNNTPVTVSKNVTLLTGNGIQVQLTQDVTLPAKT